MNETEKKYKQGDRVYFEGAGFKGWGEVNGMVGPIIIVKLEQPFANYAYSHFYVLDAQIIEAPA
jgi:hypothetical protein